MFGMMVFFGEIGDVVECVLELVGGKLVYEDKEVSSYLGYRKGVK